MLQTVPARAAMPVDTTGLVGYWGFESESGDTVSDASNHGLDGIVSKSAAYETGVEGRAMVFDGNTRVTIPFHPSLALKEWTLMCWVKTRESTDHQALISRQPSTGSPIDFRLHLSGSVGDGWSTPPGRAVPGYWNSPAPESTFTVGRTIVTDGAWHLIVGIKKAGLLLVYVDGRPDGSRIATQAPLASDTEPLTLGASNYAGGSYFLQGSLDEVRIYDYAWSDSLVAADYDRYGLPAKPVTDLIAHYDFDQSSGSVLLDKSGNGHDGAISRAEWTQGVHGNALRFDGVSDQVLVPFAQALNAPEFTLEAWIRTDEKTHDQAIIDRVEPGGNQWNYRLMVPSRIHEIEGHPVEPGVVQSDVRDNFTSRWDYIALGHTKVTLGKWRHIAATFKNRVFNIYVDGVLDGAKTVPIDAVIATSQPMLLGNCSFTPIQFHFRGDMDEVSIWKRALTAEEIAAEARLFTVKAPEVNLGMKSHFGKAGDTVWVPLYLSNFEADSISAAQFSLQYNPAVVTLLEVKADSGLAKAWPLLDWKQTLPDEAAVALGGAAVSLGYGEGEVLRFKFLIKPDAPAGATSVLELANVKFDEKGNIKVTNLPGRITVSKPSILYGDVTGNGEVDVFDAAKIVEYVVGKFTLPAPDFANFTQEVADVSGNGEITSYDAALVFQYSLGLIDHFPVETKKTQASPKRSGALAKSAGYFFPNLILEAPVRVGDDRYRYRLTGTALEGLLAGELAFEVSDPIVSFTKFSSGVQGARVSPLFDPGKGRLEIVLSTNDDLDESQVTFLDIEAEHKPGASGAGLKLVSAYLDEGRLSDPGIPSKPLVTSGIRKAAVSAPARFLSFAGSNLVIEAKAGRPLKLDVFTTQGRKVLSRTWNAAPVRIFVPESDLPEGMLLLRISSDGVMNSGSIANLQAR